MDKTINFSPALNSITPLCPHFKECGGCTYQEITYADELKESEAALQALFAPLNLPVEVIHPITYTVNEETRKPWPWHYRARMDFLFHNYALCQRKKGNFRVKVKLQECHIALPVIDVLLKAMNDWFESEQDKLPYLISPPGFNPRVLKYVTIRKSSFTPSTSITFILNREHEAHTRFLLYLGDVKERLRDFLYTYLERFPQVFDDISIPRINLLAGFVNRKQELSISEDFKVIHGSEFLEEKLCGITLRFHSQGFFQNNSAMIEKIILRIREWHTIYLEKYFTQDKPINLFDLYGGCGVFAATLGKSVDSYKSPYHELWIVDTESNNVNLAKENIENSTGINPKVFAMGVKEFLSLEMYHSKLQNGVVILDPPRSGLGGKVLKRLMKIPPRIIFYVSCKPATLVEELTTLKEIYEVKAIASFDLFPRTPHLEVLALLVRKD